MLCSTSSLILDGSIKAATGLSGQNQMHKARMRPNLADLINYGLIKPGTYSLEVGTFSGFKATIMADGRWHGMSCGSQVSVVVRRAGAAECG